MNAVLALAPRFQRAGGRDARVTTTLAITAFTVTTGLTLSVVGGLLGFIGRAAQPLAPGELDDRSLYVSLAWVAVVLLVVPLVTLAGAAARLGVARRDARLSTLRLLGATPREVVALTVAETAWQGLVGAVLGIALYVALLPVCALLPFQGTTFSVAELWVGWLGLAIAVLVVPLVGAVSGAVSLRRVNVSPLGVARRETPKGMTWLRLVVAVVGVGTFMVVSRPPVCSAPRVIGVLLGALAVGFATLNVVGPWVLGLIGKVQLRRATTPARLLAARRLLDDPKAAWRVVGGLGLGGLRGRCARRPAGDPRSTPTPTRRDAILMDDLVTAAWSRSWSRSSLAAVSAGIAQAAGVLDRRREIALQNLAGTPIELHDSVRRRTVLVPLLFVAVGSAVTALVMFFPLYGLRRR